MKTTLKLLIIALIGSSNISLAHVPEYEIQHSLSNPQNQSSFSYNFGSVRVNETSYADIYLHNRGLEPLPIQAIYVSGLGFNAWSYCPTVLPPGYRCLTRVEFRPWHEGYFWGSLRFKFPNESLVVDLYGWGRK